jgi:hypothetical protein
MPFFRHLAIANLADLTFKLLLQGASHLFETSSP